MKSSLISSVVIPLGQAQRKALEAIERWDFSRELEHTRTDMLALGQCPSDEYLDRGIEALRKYHAIAVLDPLNGHAISEPLDPFWHSQILFTDPYTRFCNLTLGQYMHHYPLDHRDVVRVCGVRKLYDYTIEVHRAIFGRDCPEFYPVNVTDHELICVHAKDCEHTSSICMETRFSERTELVIN